MGSGTLPSVFLLMQHPVFWGIRVVLSDEKYYLSVVMGRLNHADNLPGVIPDPHRNTKPWRVCVCVSAHKERCGPAGTYNLNKGKKSGPWGKQGGATLRARE